jgi:hypothetical protein
LGLDSSIFFTEDDNDNYTGLNVVKKMCFNCPAKEECYDYSIENLVQGIWAGTTFNERDFIRKQRGIKGKEIVDNVET